MTDETLEQSTKQDAILQAIAELSAKIDSVQTELSKKIDGVQSELTAFKRETGVQFEAIREGIVDNSVAFDRLQSIVFNLRADVVEFTEEIRRDKLALK